MQKNRQQMRLRSWDYNTPGIYFLTFCTNQKRSILSHIVGRDIPDAPCIRLTDYGEFVQDALVFLTAGSRKWKLHHYVIMPNHVHLLLELCGSKAEEKGASGMSRPTEAAIPRMISSIKRYTNRLSGQQLWQDGYYDHVIRDEKDFLRIWNYIDGNPIRWVDDIFYTKEEK